MNYRNLVSLAGMAATLISGGAAAQEACSTYTVQDGDTLPTIAIAALGTSNYQSIFNANRSIISNPNDLEVGMGLLIPCADGSLPNGLSAREIIANEEQRNAGNRRAGSYEPPIKLVAANGWPPFGDEGLNGGGLLTRLVATALNRAGNSREYSVSWVDDWNAHIDTLLPLGAFDVSLGWDMPDCTNKTYEWSWETEVRCNQFDASLSFYDVVVGYFTLPDSEYAKAEAMEDYKGATICRMDGWFIHDLEEAGLRDPVITLLQPITPRECLDAVLTGQADVATFEVQIFEDTKTEMGLTVNDLVENPYVSGISTLRMLSHKSNPFGRQYLAMLNKGLKEMQDSGEWHAIVSDSLREHNELLTAASN